MRLANRSAFLLDRTSGRLLVGLIVGMFILNEIARLPVSGRLAFRGTAASLLEIKLVFKRSKWELQGPGSCLVLGKLTHLLGL